MVDSAGIEVFLALAEELHFGRTASRLYMPQPRVNRLLAALEQKVGGKLSAAQAVRSGSLRSAASSAPSWRPAGRRSPRRTAGGAHPACPGV